MCERLIRDTWLKRFMAWQARQPVLAIIDFRRDDKRLGGLALDMSGECSVSACGEWATIWTVFCFKGVRIFIKLPILPLRPVGDGTASSGIAIPSVSASA